MLLRDWHDQVGDGVEEYGRITMILDGIESLVTMDEMMNDKVERVSVPVYVESPMDPSLRNELLHSLIQVDAVQDIQNVMSTECRAADWQGKVHERALQLLRQGHVQSVQQLSLQLTKEALVTKTPESQPSEMSAAAKSLPSKIDSSHSAIDVAVPRQAIEKATVVVQAALDKAVNVDPLEDPVWRDWE